MGLGEWEIVIILIAIVGVCAAAFFVYLLYVCYLKKCKSYRYENGVPQVAILRESRFGSAGIKHFSAAAFRTSQISISSADRKNLVSQPEDPRRPHTFPLTSSSKVPNLPEIRIDPA